MKYLFLASLITLLNVGEKAKNTLIGKWQVTQVKEIGSWSIKHNDLTSQYKGITVEFLDSGNCKITSNEQEEVFMWELHQYLEKSWGVSSVENITVQNPVFYPRADIKITSMKEHILPPEWKRVRLTKKKLIFYTFQEKGRVKYTLRKVE